MELACAHGGGGIAKAQDAAAPAYLANLVDCGDLVKEILGGQNIGLTDNPGGSETWQSLRDTLNTTIRLSPAVEEHLKGLKLDNAHPSREDLGTFLKKQKPPGEKSQHFLSSIRAPPA